MRRDPRGFHCRSSAPPLHCSSDLSPTNQFSLSTFCLRRMWGRVFYFSVFCEVNFQSLGVILESQRCHGKQYILSIDRLSLLLLTFLGGWGKSLPLSDYELVRRGILPSLVIKLMNSLTHSCMHSFASFAILALSGSAVFMIRATGRRSALVSLVP